jgi:hypothetical protein
MNPLEAYDWAFAVSRTLLRSPGGAGWSTLRRIYYDIRNELEPNKFVYRLVRAIADLRFEGVDVGVKKDILDVPSMGGPAFYGVQAAILAGMSNAFPPSERREVAEGG